MLGRTITHALVGLDARRVEAALQRETQDGPGTDDLDSLPESDVPAGEKLAEEYIDLEPRGEDLEASPDDKEAAE